MTTGRDAPPDVGVPLTAPPRTTLTELTRRWWRSQGRHRGLVHWMRLQGILILIPFVLIFVANGWANGWTRAYNVMVTIDSPAEADHAVLAWPLSIAGWLVGPAVAGAVAGFVITSWINERRTRPFALPDADGDDV